MHADFRATAGKRRQVPAGSTAQPAAARHADPAQTQVTGAAAVGQRHVAAAVREHALLI